MRLHIGGTEPLNGWKLMNIKAADGVDYVGDIQDLSRFADESCEAIYVSHVLEHIKRGNLIPTLAGIRRLLTPDGHLLVSVPDLEVLCGLFLRPDLSIEQRLHVISMIYGGQADDYDYHYIGFNYDLLVHCLKLAGFSKVEKISSFGLFSDMSCFAPGGTPISLNVVVSK